MGRKSQKEGLYIYIWLIHLAVQQKLTQCGERERMHIYTHWYTHHQCQHLHRDTNTHAGINTKKAFKISYSRGTGRKLGYLVPVPYLVSLAVSGLSQGLLLLGVGVVRLQLNFSQGYQVLADNGPRNLGTVSIYAHPFGTQGQSYFFLLASTSQYLTHRGRLLCLEHNPMVCLVTSIPSFPFIEEKGPLRVLPIFPDFQPATKVSRSP